LPLDVVVIDADNRFVYVNAAANPDPEIRRWMIGRTEEEYGSHRGLPGDLVERRQALYSRVRATGKPVTFEEARPRTDGQGVRWTLKRLFPLPAGGDEAGGLLLGCALDVSDRVQAETNLRGSEARYRTLLNSLLDLLMIVDDDGVVTYAAPSARQLLGTSPSDLVRRRLEVLVHPDDRADLAELLSGEHDDMVELRLQRLDDSVARLDSEPSPPTWRHFEAQAADLRTHPQVGGFVVVARDITQRLHAEQAARASEEALRQSQKMEALGRLAGGLAHDFNNLLTAIQGYCGLLKETALGDLQAGYVREIAAAGDRAADLTQKLLTLSRRQLVSRRVVAVNELVGDLQGLLRRLIGEDIELVTDLAPEVGQVRADPHQLDQALLNLAVNARDAMPLGGRMLVRTESVDLSFDDVERRPELQPGPHVLLSVSDTGVGMDHETLEHIFEPFFTTKESGKGTGLGLATVYASIQQEGGRVEVDSAPGRGAVFRIFLPHVEEEPEALPEAPAGRGKLRGSERILLVEDEDIVRRLVRQQLESLGYTVLDAGKGETALEIAENHEIDILVSDVVMPGMSGPELARRLVDRRPGLPVLFMSGYTDAFLGRHGFADGDHEVLQKPFDQSELASRIRDLLDRR
jgi:PAS domain S-box-containing protein